MSGHEAEERSVWTGAEAPDHVQARHVLSSVLVADANECGKRPRYRHLPSVICVFDYLCLRQSMPNCECEMMKNEV